MIQASPLLTSILNAERPPHMQVEFGWKMKDIYFVFLELLLKSFENKPGVIREWGENRLPFPDVLARWFPGKGWKKLLLILASTANKSFCSGAERTWTYLDSAWIQTWNLSFLLHPFLFLYLVRLKALFYFACLLRLSWWLWVLSASELLIRD